jgi:bacteriorhodopsin
LLTVGLPNVKMVDCGNICFVVAADEWLTGVVHDVTWHYIIRTMNDECYYYMYWTVGVTSGLKVLLDP